MDILIAAETPCKIAHGVDDPELVRHVAQVLSQQSRQDHPPERIMILEKLEQPKGREKNDSRGEKGGKSQAGVEEEILQRIDCAGACVPAWLMT